MKKGKLRGALIRALGGYETQQSMPDLGPLFQSPVLSSAETLKFHKIQSTATVRRVKNESPDELVSAAQAMATEALFSRVDSFSPAVSFKNDINYADETCTVTATIFVGYKEVTPGG